MSAARRVVRPDGFPACDALGEGVFWDGVDQALYWVDIVQRRAMRRSLDGAFRQWTLPSVCAAIIPTTRGDHVVALQDGVHRLDIETGALRLHARPDPDPGNRSNDTRTDAHGGLWLGTMGNNIGPDGETVALKPESGGLYCLRPDGSVQPMLSGLGISNALAFTPDGRRITVADTTKDVIWSFAIDPDTGALHDRRVLLEGGPGHPDGAAMDEAGRLWNARWGAGLVIRITPDGRVDRTVELPCRQPSCCAFGGEDRRTLYVTSAAQDLADAGPDDGALFAVEVDVPGLPMARFGG